MLVVGILASVSFSQFLALFFSDPKVTVGAFMVIVEVYSFFLFKEYFLTGYFLPNMFFCFAISQQITNSLHSRNIHYDAHISEPLQVLVLTTQTVVFFTLAVLIDRVRRTKTLWLFKSPKSE